MPSDTTCSSSGPRIVASLRLSSKVTTHVQRGVPEAWFALEAGSFRPGGVFLYYNDIIMKKVHLKFKVSGLLIRQWF